MLFMYPLKRRFICETSCLRITCDVLQLRTDVGVHNLLKDGTVVVVEFCQSFVKTCCLALQALVNIYHAIEYQILTDKT